MVMRERPSLKCPQVLCPIAPATAMPEPCIAEVGRITVQHHGLASGWSHRSPRFICLCTIHPGHILTPSSEQSAVSAAICRSSAARTAHIIGAGFAFCGIVLAIHHDEPRRISRATEEIPSMITISRPRTNVKQNPPTRAEIRRETEAIRKQWSQKTRLKRSGKSARMIAVLELPSVPRRKGYEVD